MDDINELESKADEMHNQLQKDSIELSRLLEKVYNNKKELQILYEKLEKVKSPVQEIE